MTISKSKRQIKRKVDNKEIKRVKTIAKPLGYTPISGKLPKGLYRPPIDFRNLNESDVNMYSHDEINRMFDLELERRKK